MPPPSKQLRILKSLRALLEGINPTEIDPAYELCGQPAENYDIDLRSKVFFGKTTIGTDVTLPALSVLEAPTPVAALHGGEEGVLKYENWRLLLQGFARNDQANPTEPAYALKAQVEQRLSRVIAVKQRNGDPLFPEHYMLGSLIGGLTISQGVVRPPEEKISATAFFYIPLIVNMGTNAANPY